MTALWYTARGTGVVALLLLTATVALGAVGTARVETRRWPRVVTAQLHRHLSLLVVAFVAVHVAATVLDPFAPVGWAAAMVPFSSAYRPVWLGLGAVALDFLLAVLVTSLLRARMGYRTWRAVHWLAYASWPVALWHGLGTGTDSRLTPMLGLDAACVAVVACALWLRLGLLPQVARRAAVGSAAVAVALATAVFAVTGPLQPGWARRAGTPPQLLSGAVIYAGQPTAAPGHRHPVTITGPGS
jgi:sulfoxide reductase heme-binding subunit YedZ